MLMSPAPNSPSAGRGAWTMWHSGTTASPSTTPSLITCRSGVRCTVPQSTATSLSNRIGGQHYQRTDQSEGQRRALFGNERHSRHDAQHRHYREPGQAGVAPHTNTQLFGRLLLQTSTHPQLSDGNEHVDENRNCSVGVH